MKTLLLVLVVTAAEARIKLHSTCIDGVYSDSISGGSVWGYGESNGPNTWPNNHPTCGGSRQSPVALVSAEAITNSTWEPFRFVNYDYMPSTTMVTNTGQAVEVRQACGASVSGGNLKGEYTFAQIHFHWGNNDTSGSEHSVDGAKFAAEIHLVHYRRSHGSLSEAVHHTGGVAVLTIMVRLSPTDNPKLRPIVSSLLEITKPQEVTTIDPMTLKDVLPGNVDDFFRYEGSLTTPGCNEVVVWTVFRDAITISHNQLQLFRGLVSSDGTPMLDNCRPIQPLFGRTVYRSWD